MLKLFTKAKYGFFWVINEPKNKTNKKDQIASAIFCYSFLIILGLGALGIYIAVIRIIIDKLF